MASYTSSNYSTTTSSDSTSWYRRFVPWASGSTSSSTTDSSTLDDAFGLITTTLSQLDDGQAVSDHDKQRTYDAAKLIKRMNSLDRLHGELEQLAFQQNSPAAPTFEKIRYIVKNKFINCGYGCGHICETRFAHHLMKWVGSDWSKEMVLGALIAGGSSASYALGRSKALDDPATILVGGGVGVGAVVVLRIGLAAIRAYSDTP